MAPISVKKDDLPVEKIGIYEGRTAQVGEYTIAFETVPGGSPPIGDKAYTGLPDDACQCPHWGYLVKGRFRVLFPDDGSEEIVTAGSAYYLRPGHRYAALDDVEVIEFSLTSELARTSAMVAKNVAAAQGGAS